jgi:hypothetical protein
MSPDQNLEPKNLIADAIDAAEDMPDPVAGLAENTAADPGAPLAQSADGPIPLFPRMPPAEPFPVEALGPILSDAAAAISRIVQVPLAMAAQSVLAAASLAAQAHADVRLPYGQSRPLSLFFVTIAGSGDRKTTADREALRPIREHEKNLKEVHDRDYRNYSISKAAWDAEKRRIEHNRGLNFEARKEALRALGPEPERPLHPIMIASDPTIEGLIKAWVHAPASLGLFTAEGGQFIGGHALSQDHRLKTAANLSRGWDGEPFERLRAGDGVTLLLGRRLAIHLMVQPDAAAGFLADRVLRDQGLFSRLLVAAPDSLAGSRSYCEPDPCDEQAIKFYLARILAILKWDWPLTAGKLNELEPRVLKMSAGAEQVWKAFFNHIESQCGKDGDLRPIVDFAAKAAEHAARIAGVLAIVDSALAIEINDITMKRAIEIADWYVGEADRLAQAARTDSRLLRAQTLLDWLRARSKEHGAEVIHFREIIQFGPAPLRTKDAADNAVRILLEHGHLKEVSSRPRRYQLVEEE